MRQRILVVDDEPMIGRGITRLLRSEHEVEWVPSVAAALSMIERDAGAYALVVSDLLMPDQSGMDFYAEVERRWPELAKRMLFLTGGAANDSSRLFIDSLGGKCIMKPFSGDDLKSAVSQVIRAG